jgi:hypothetical protein
MPKVEMPKLEMPKFEMPKVDMSRAKLPEVDVVAMTNQAKDRVTVTAKSVRGNVSHTIDLIREAVGV